MSIGINFKKSLVSLIAIVFLVSLLAMFLSPSANAEESKEPSNTQLDAEAEFIQNEALQTDEQGQPIGIDLTKVKERHGYVPKEAKEADQYLKEKSQGSVTREVGDNYDNNSDCTLSEMTKQFGSALPPAVIATVAEAWKSGNLSKGVKALGKAGFKGSGFGTVYTIAKISIQCDYKYGVGL